MTDYPMKMTHPITHGSAIARDARAAKILAASGWDPETTPSVPIPSAKHPDVPADTDTKADWARYAATFDPPLDVDAKQLKPQFIAAVKAAIDARTQAETPADDVSPAEGGEHDAEPTGTDDPTHTEEA